MAVAIETLKEKIVRIQQELAEVEAALNELQTTNAAAPPEAAPPAQKSHPLAGRPTSDKAAWRQAFDALFKQMGIDHVKPIGAEKLQELMRQDGIKPEDCIGSRGIIEMREE